MTSNPIPSHLQPDLSTHLPESWACLMAQPSIVPSRAWVLVTSCPHGARSKNPSCSVGLLCVCPVGSSMGQAVSFCHSFNFMLWPESEKLSKQVAQSLEDKSTSQEIRSSILTSIELCSWRAKRYNPVTLEKKDHSQNVKATLKTELIKMCTFI